MVGNGSFFYVYNSSKNKIHSNVSDANPAKKLKKTVKKGKYK